MVVNESLWMLCANSGAGVHLIPEIAEHFNKGILNIASFIKSAD